ncbi:tetraacyldisaccharide 4'-kinase [Maribacter cobaltidurans]|uniref:Tetraacyldisaccharide 4'-kinase n=1 Tax=Maribacter cobaltidurans TaxID=1178778 RepID=A0A223V8C4_9FLAO|nr:tetraacyldisaccharide 4'-kinase [Maribacter cobaltidurans]ASV31238.1 tetraacyldisaccharide 4'-kinase [Maribacter cobaltidurans]GGD83964.1 tetraacyldisaccharide 4'-kinase [Maribacter cobaltidurans]
MQLLRKLLFPFSLLYGAVVHIRNFLYDRNILISKKFDVTTICIGNLSVGGTGKTPMTEFLIELLQPHYKIAVLSRGYRRKSAGFVLANESTTVEELGDEPFQIHQKFKDTTVAVDANRREGIKKLSEQVSPNLILLDDAYQHRKVKPDFSLLLTSFGDLYVDDWYLPTGNLRDSKKAAGRAHVIIVTKCPQGLSEDDQERIKKKLKPKKHQKVLFSYLEYDNMVHGHLHQLEVEELKGRKITLVTGIANPVPLVNHLKNMGLDLDHLAFGDHHFFSEREVETLKKKEIIVTTEKDYVRLGKGIPNLYYLQVKHRFMDDGKQMISEALQEIMKGKS